MRHNIIWGGPSKAACFGALSKGCVGFVGNWSGYGVPRGIRIGRCEYGGVARFVDKIMTVIWDGVHLI